MEETENKIKKRGATEFSFEELNYKELFRKNCEAKKKQSALIPSPLHPQ